MITKVKIKNRIIGENEPTFFIAEMACAHQGIVQNARDLVDVAVKAKADAVQLQVFKKEAYMSPLYKDYELINRLELSQDDWLKVIKFIKNEDILFFAAAYDLESIKFLLKNEVDAFKIHSADISNPEVLRAVAESQKPIFLSCGASKIDEIQKAIQFLKKLGTKDIILMHGYQGFPTKIEDCHLNYIKTLQRVFGLNIGFYDHVDGGLSLAKIIPIMAIGYGAQILEKHFILTRENKGIDYESSLDKDNFIDFGYILRECEKAIGSKEVRNFTEGELTYRAYCKKSIVAWQDIARSTKIRREHVNFVRNDPGISPDEFYKIEGKVVKKDIKKYHNLSYDDF